MNRDPQRLVLREYNHAHWPANMLPDEWRKIDFDPIIERAVADLTKDKTKQKLFMRIAGQSGAGKSTQLLPMVNAYFDELGITPVILAARLFVPYHPYLKQIKETVSKEYLRESTHEFVVQMLFEVIIRMIEDGYAVVVDVSLLDPKIEAFLVEALQAENYRSELQMIAVAKEISDSFIKKRELCGAEGSRKVRNHTAEEFARATPLALGYYAQAMPQMQVSMWSAWDESPIFEGKSSDPMMMKTWQKYQKIAKLPHETDEDTLRDAKIKWAKQKAGKAIRS